MNRSHGLLRPFAILTAVSLISACSGGGGGTPTPVRTATPVPATPSPTPVAITSGGGGSLAATCASSSGAAATRSSGQSERRRQIVRVNKAASRSTGLVAVTYAAAPSDTTAMASRERSLGANLRREISFRHIGRYTRVLAVTPGTEDAAIQSLRSAPGVLSATITGEKRYREAVTTPYYPNDPYYNGFTAAQNLSAGNAAPSTYHVACDEAASVPGQWDMHVIRLEHAMGYGQSGNGSGIVDTGALGKSSIKLANIDSGQDTTHPELASKIVYQKSYVTTNGHQTVTNSTSDEDGHGTDTSGLAVDAVNNGVGFIGTGGNVSLMGYQVFPTPDDTCVPGAPNPDDTCGADTQDIADAIMDAVSQHANVISLSLGGGGCTASGADEDSIEGNAIADAIAADVIVVAASGNAGGSGVSAPGCDPGVIAAGATSLDDGAANGSGHTGGTTAAPVEYVASYSQYGSPAKAVNSSSAWGIVAPGGDPTDDNDADDLHWIENIWTSTPLDSKFAGNCNVDYPGTGSTDDCRTLIAGTSMSTPIIAGTAALIISANAAYQNPAMMKQLLCSTAHDINDPAEGCGRLDAYRAMAVAVGDTSPPASQ